MGQRNQKTDSGLVDLIDHLKAQTRETGSSIWRDVAIRLEKSRSNWAEPNLSRLSRHSITMNQSQSDVAVLVPGKLLGSGEINAKATVAAYSVSAGARSKIEAAGGRVLTILELMEENPEGKGVQILG